MDVPSLGFHFRSLVLRGLRAFLLTWLAMAIGGIVVAVVSGDWMPEVDPVYRTLLQILFALQFIVVGFFLGMRRALAAALTSGVRSLELGRRTSGALFRQFDAGEGLGRFDDDPKLTGKPATVRAVSDEQLSAALLDERLGRIVSALAFGSVQSGWRRRGILGWLQAVLTSAIGAITMARFRKKTGRIGHIDTVSLRQDLEAQIDDLLLARLRYTLLAWTAIVVSLLLAEVAVIVYIANRLAA